MGSTKMKQLAHSYLWWPGLDSDIDRLSSQCSVCLVHRSSPKKAPLHPWDWPEKPWLRLHADYAGPVMGMYSLVMIDAHTKWIEILPTKDTSSADEACVFTFWITNDIGHGQCFKYLFQRI